MPSLDDVSRLAALLPGSEQRVSGGGEAWFVRSKPYAWESMPWPSEAEQIRETVASEPCLGLVLPSEDDRRALVQMRPEAFLVSETPWLGTKIIVRLEAIDLDHLTELVTEAWRTRAPQYLRREWDATRGDDDRGG